MIAAARLLPRQPLRRRRLSSFPHPRENRNRSFAKSYISWDRETGPAPPRLPAGARPATDQATPCAEEIGRCANDPEPPAPRRRLDISPFVPDAACTTSLEPRRYRMGLLSV